VSTLSLQPGPLRRLAGQPILGGDP
jgi:hypothetical protein